MNFWFTAFLLLFLASPARSSPGDANYIEEQLTIGEDIKTSNPNRAAEIIEEIADLQRYATPNQRQRLELLAIHNTAMKGNYDIAVTRLKSFVSTVGIEPDQLLRAKTLLANIHYARDEYDDAFRELNEALTELNALTNSKSAYDVNVVAATLLATAGATDQALDLAGRALENAHQSKNRDHECRAWHATASSFQMAERWSEALTAYQRQHETCSAVENEVFISAAEYGQGICFQALGDHGKAIKSIRSSISRIDDGSFVTGVTSRSISLAKSLFSTNQSVEAFSLLEKYIPLAEQQELHRDLAEGYRELAIQYKRLEKFDLALSNFEKFVTADSLASSKDAQIRTAFFRMQFEADYKEKKIQLLEREKKFLAENAAHQTEKRRLLQFGVGAVSIICILLMLALHRLRNQSLQLRKLAQIDGLTGLHNRRHALMLAEQLYASCLRRNSHLAVVMVDLDLFKEINDRFGHAAGDEVLRNAARHFASCLRKQDVIGRTGGEEFAIFLPDTDLNAAITVVERCRTGVGEVQEGEQRRSVTASFGIAVGINDRFTLDELLQQADKALYNAKANGRNQVALARDLAYAASAYDEPASLI